MKEDLPKFQLAGITETGVHSGKKLHACYYIMYDIVRFPQASLSTRIWISNLSCDPARDLTVYHCPRSSGLSCIHSQDVALECSSPYAIGLKFHSVAVVIEF